MRNSQGHRLVETFESQLLYASSEVFKPILYNIIEEYRKGSNSAFLVNNVDKYIMYFMFSMREKLGLRSPWQSPYICFPFQRTQKNSYVTNHEDIHYMKDAFKPEYFICFEHRTWMQRCRIEKKLNKKERQHKIFQQHTLHKNTTTIVK